jgi:hypothetical protein
VDVLRVKSVVVQSRRAFAPAVENPHPNAPARRKKKAPDIHRFFMSKSFEFQGMPPRRNMEGDYITM